MPTRHCNFTGLSDSVRRQLAASYKDRRAYFGLKGGVERDLLVTGLAVDGGDDEHPYRHVYLLGTRYDSGEVTVVPIADIEWVERRDLHLTDPGHPAYEKPEQVVTSFPRRKP